MKTPARLSADKPKLRQLLRASTKTPKKISYVTYMDALVQYGKYSEVMNSVSIEAEMEVLLLGRYLLNRARVSLRHDEDEMTKVCIVIAEHISDSAELREEKIALLGDVMTCAAEMGSVAVLRSVIQKFPCTLWWSGTETIRGVLREGISYQHTDFVRYLIPHMCYADIYDNDKRCIRDAALDNNPEILDLLIHDVDVDHLTEHGQYLVLHAVVTGSVWVAKVIHDRIGKVYYKDVLTRTGTTRRVNTFQYSTRVKLALGRLCTAEKNEFKFLLEGDRYREKTRMTRAITAKEVPHCNTEGMQVEVK